MDTQSLIILLIIGGFSGWLASKIVNGGGLGLIGDIAVGIIGAFIGSWLLPKVGFHVGVGVVGFIVVATIGAIVLLALVRLVRRV